MPASGFRPRDGTERILIAMYLRVGGTRPPDEDGFVTACEQVALQRPSAAGLTPVTIVICTFNRVHLLPEAVASARAQDWPVRIVVVDDGSVDGTPAWLASQPDLRVLTHTPNRGKPAALDTAIAAIDTDTFLVLDDDDELLPGSVRVLSEALAKHPEAVAAWGDTVVFDGSSGLPIEWRAATRLPMTKRAVLTTIPALPGATLVRTAAQRLAGPFDPRLVRGQDMDQFLRLSELGPAITVPLPVLWYRRHDGLRGSAAGQWRKHADPGEHRKRFLACVQPVFLERWALSRPERDEGFAWAVGLAERGLANEARRELSRWPGPYSPHEAWVAARVGTSHPPARQGPGRVIVVDDGDDGALEQTLAYHGAATGALGRRALLEVVLARPRDTIGGAQIFWPGAYRAATTMRATGSARLCLSSTPSWISPPVDATLLPPLPPGCSVRALAWALGWDLPAPSRAIHDSPLHPIAGACRDAAGRNGAAALAPAVAVMQALPGWKPGLVLGARACDSAGLVDDAASLRRAAGPPAEGLTLGA